jgi:uncharacterized protein (TIGR00251 family)
MIPIRDSASGASFAVRVHPRAKKTAITGILGEGADTTLKVALAAPPVDGRANETLIDYFSDFFEVPRAAVSIISGAQSRTKVLRVSGVSAAELARMLAPRVDAL